ncbi:MAG: LTA synthase family protein [Bacillota bacterium]|nr:LTA synthase family protein [Bacillota bacterium]
MASSEVGGGTANVEFEALTGLSTAFLPGGSIAYSQYIKQPLPSLPRLLKEYGYTTIAVHPYVSTFWNRNKVYPLIGFDNFVTIKDMKDVSKKGNYASDDYFVHQIIAQYQKYSADDKPLFVFGVSMQNHFPYSKGVYGQNDIKITGNGLGSYKTGMFECYSQGISDADASLKTLIDYFKTVDRPVNIVFFGDHFPALKGIELNKLSAKTSVSPYIDRNSEYFDSLINKFTPVVFWSNYDAKIPNCEGHQYSSLSYSVLDFAGLPKNPYFSLLSQIGSELPIIQNGITVTPDGKIGSFKDSPKDVFEKARIINYDSIFGKRYALEDLWH